MLIPTSSPAAMSPAEVTEKLGLHRMRDRSWFVHPSCATSGEVRPEKGLACHGGADVPSFMICVDAGTI